MSRTITIRGSDEVMAMIGGRGSFLRGKWQDVEVTEIGPDENTPIEVREGLVGLVIPTIFTKESLEEQGANLDLPEGARLAYSTDVINILESAQKYDEARQLAKIIPDPLDMYVLEKGTYEII